MWRWRIELALLYLIVTVSAVVLFWLGVNL
jgi:hypothetical protein